MQTYCIIIPLACTVTFRSVCETITRAFVIDAVMTRLIEDSMFNELLLTRETQLCETAYARGCAREHVTQVGFRCKCRLRAYKIAHLPRSCRNARATYSKSVPCNNRRYNTPPKVERILP